jgi:tagatose-1,6-bisphosphate aldolase
VDAAGCRTGATGATGAALTGSLRGGSQEVGVQAISDPDGSIRVLAIDHRDSMRQFLSPGNPAEIAASVITELKIDIIRALIDGASGVMLEPEFSIPQVIDAGLVPGHVGVIAALESQGYLADPSAAITTVLDGWSPELALAAGASMAKLLLPYRPGSVLASAQEDVARTVLDACEAAGIPLVLEPLLWGVTNPSEQTELIVETVERFAALSPGVLKIPFPGDSSTGEARRACGTITGICQARGVPWAVLSGGGSFERFEQQLAVAVAEGCSGFMVGRALWGEAALAAPGERAAILADLVAPRFERLSAIVRG